MTGQTDPPTRVFLDANVMFAAAMGGLGALKLWGLPNVVLVTTEYAAKEAWENLVWTPDPDGCRDRLQTLLEAVELHPHQDDTGRLFCAWALPDPEDVPILLGAIEHDCEYLLTLDTACFGNFCGACLDGVTILKPGKFLDLLGH